MDLGSIRKVNINSEMQQSYLDYAMSVIVSRALPDARDGLKPVQRRILYAMYDMGLRPETAYKKSARIVGEVLGKYHPHGDMAVYEAMARMAQDFSMRYTLVDGQGNFGSVDGDPPAAMRYTEARLADPATYMLAQIEKDTVDFTANFDDTLQEPEVLPAAIPNLLVNGATGIAVGMATNIPPHNLGEVVDALVFMLERWEKLDDIPIDELMKFIAGPDFPTGGVILQDPQSEGLAGAYATGRGKVIVQARAHLEDMGRGRSRIIVTELPYMANKANLIERIAELVRDGSLEGVADLRDESDRHGMRIVIELTKNAEPEKILRALYHRTPMQSTFGIALLALVNGEPHWLSLKQALRVYLEHRLEVIRRRSEYDLEKAKARAHILEGLRIALQNLDEIIQIIRNSADVDTARKRLMSRYKLSEIQANAILDMPLRRLAALERKKIELEYKEVSELIKSLETLLHSPKKIRQVASDELLEVKRLYADRRRTQIVKLKEGESVASMLTTNDVTPAEMVWVGVSRDGRICRSVGDAPLNESGLDAPRWLLHTSTHHTLYMVTQAGRAAAVPVHAIPEASRPSEGALFYKVAPLEEDDIFSGCFALPSQLPADQEEYVLTVSANGLVKKSSLAELPGPSSQSFLLARVNEGDALTGVLHTSGQAEVLLFTRQGMAIRFSEGEVRPMGLNAAGVGGIKLAAGDQVISAGLVQDGAEVFLLSSDGKGKRVAMKDFPAQARYGQGVIAWKLAKNLTLVSALLGQAGDEVIVHFEKEDPIAVQRADAPLVTRANQGKPVVEIDQGDSLFCASPAAASAGSGPITGAGETGEQKPKSRAKSTAAGKSTPKTVKAPPVGKTTPQSTKTGAAKAKPTGKTDAKTAPPAKAAPSKPQTTKTTTKTATAKATPSKAPTAKTPSPDKPPAASAASKATPVPETAPRKARSGAGKPAAGEQLTLLPVEGEKSTRRGTAAPALPPEGAKPAEVKQTVRHKSQAAAPGETVKSATPPAKPAAPKPTPGSPEKSAGKAEKNPSTQTGEKTTPKKPATRPKTPPEK